MVTMKNPNRRGTDAAAKRKKIAIFVGLCVVTILVITLVIVLVHLLKSENDEVEIPKMGKYFRNHRDCATIIVHSKGTKL